MSSIPSFHSAPQPATTAPEKYLIAFVIQGEDVFKITADNIIHTIGTATGPAFDAIAKLKAAAALLELTNRHKERPDELRQMARELANEGMKLMARASSTIQTIAQPVAPVDVLTPPTASQPETAITAEDLLTETAVVAGPAPVEATSSTSVHALTNSKIALISG